jgi:formylglycine-generating enzyme required for sulfatase activity
LACYEEVLKKEPMNEDAMAGIEKIEARYVSWIKRALDRGQTKRAKRYLASLRLVNPESPQLADFEAQPSLGNADSSVNKKLFRDSLKDGSLGPEMVWIPAGSFQMVAVMIMRNRYISCMIRRAMYGSGYRIGTTAK